DFKRLGVQVGETYSYDSIGSFCGDFLGRSTPKENNKEFFCYSSNRDVVKVINSGYNAPKVIGVSAGKATLYWKNSNNETILETKITVTNPVNSVKLNKTSVKVSKGKEAIVKAISVVGEKYNDGIIKWYTSKKATMKVLNTSKDTTAVRIKGLKKGTCYLVAKNSNGRELRRIKVTVK
ncbi:MAG: hypothetical protein ACI4QE_04845, partial [Acutalibacteraceae bacterium]